MASRHERRKRAKALALVRERQAIIRANLSAPADRSFVRGTLVSPVYRGEQDRARGRGVTPMTHKVTAVYTRRPDIVRPLYPAGTKIITVR
jgi:hypothetical protein